uniref:arginase n=1 Tax=Glycine max TaxID=3847 RepID=C6TI22_SOYBN|nr:unknown [Glycine max]
MSFLRSFARNKDISKVGRRGIHCMQKLCAEKISPDSLEKAQNRVIDAALTLVRENTRLKKELVHSLGGAVATSTLLGVPLGHNSSFLEGPAFAPPFIREGIWCGSANSTTEEGKDLKDLRIMVDVGDIPIQEMRDCGIGDERLMKVVSDSVKLVMEEDPLRPLILGGNHSISYPVVRAISEKLGGPVDVLHFDAHPDLYDEFEGNYYSHASSFARIMEGGYARRLLQVGIRSINKEGREQAKKFGVEQFEMRHFSKDRPFLENLNLGEGAKGVYISIDVDCLDPGYAVGVSHYESGGLSFRDVMSMLQNLKGDIVGGDVVEYNPQRDTPDRMTAMVAAKFVRELAAKMSK